MAAKRRKVLIIGLDGASWDAIGPWMDEGALPNLARVRAQGVSGVLMSCMPFLSCPAWKVFSTGKNPGNLGIFGFHLVQREPFRCLPVTGEFFPGEEIWDVLTRARIKSCVVNVPFTYPVKEIDGTLISGGFAPTTEGKLTHPDAIADEIRKVRPDYHIIPRSVLQAGSYVNFYEELRQILEVVDDVGRHMLRTKEWQFGIVVHRETDAMQHYTWGHAFPGHPTYTDERHAKYGHFLKDYWIETDRSVGRILEDVGGEVNVLIMSDHGFGPLDKRINMNEWLSREGYLFYERRRPPSAAERFGLSRGGITRALKVLRMQRLIKRIVPKSVSDKIRDTVPMERGQIPLEKVVVDWSRSKVVSDYFGQFYLNPRYRSNGAATDEGRAVILDVCRKLSQLRDFDHGDEPISVEPIWGTDIWSGERTQNAPDAMIKISDWRIGYTGQVETNGVWGLVEERETTHMLYAANHRREGIILGIGPDIGQGVIEGAELMDLAPTVLHMAGAGVPDDMDGKVLRDLFCADSPLATEEVEYQPGVEAGAVVEDVSEQDEEALRKHLEDLGYM
jgi:predicted AlkP superfamily phosphohydrolase/phosphomutase